MASRRDWLNEGLAILAEHGAPSITIERLCDRLGLTKGSFYHHFKGMKAFRTALLEHFESEHTARLIDEVEHDPALSARAKLNHLLDLVLASAPRAGPELEIGMRAWAQQDVEAARTQERVDRTRIDYVRSLTSGFDVDHTTADAMASLLYLTLIGAGHVIPPVLAAELRELFRTIIKLADQEPA